MDWNNNYLVVRAQEWNEPASQSYPYPFVEEQEVFSAYHGLMQNLLKTLK